MRGDGMKTVKLILSLFFIMLLGACASSEEPNGANLFSSNCVACHGAKADGVGGSSGKNIIGKTAAQINQAINGGVAEMSVLRGLSSAEVDAIAAYLATLQTSSKLSKVSIVIDGTIQDDQDVSGVVDLKDNSGQFVELEIENGEFVFDSATLRSPVLLKFVDDQGSVLFGLSDGQDQSTVISPATDDAIQQYVDAEQLFDACDEMSDGCFDVLDDEEIFDAVRAVGN